MNTSFLIVVLACFLAIGGFGDKSPMEDRCGKNITIDNLGAILETISESAAYLDLCGNQLTIFDSSLFNRFEHLEWLVFNNNPELKFPPDGSPFLRLKSLTNLQCVNCGIEKIFNRSLQDLPKIERINFTNNRITDIERDAFRWNSELQIIDLQRNELKRVLSEMIEELSKTELLDLSFNRNLNAEREQPFLISKSLKQLKCAGCGFTVIYQQTFAKLPSLQELDLRENAITIVESDSFKLQSNLVQLWLQNNKIENIYVELLENEQLSQLCLNNNTDKLVCDLKDHEKWENLTQLNCGDVTMTEVDCTRFTEPPTESTTIVETVPTSEERSISFKEQITTTSEISTPTTETPSSAEVTTTTTQKPPEPIGISDWYISSYLTIIILTQIGAMVILMGVWLKMKKYDSDPEVDNLAGTILNPSSIYKPLY